MRLSQANHSTAKPPQATKARRLVPETRQGYILLCMALWSVISFLVISNFVVSTVTVTGVSMVPTLFPGQVYLLNRWSHRLFSPSYGDLVVVRDRFSGDLLVKRVIALPNDTISFRRGHVLLNGRALHEPYLPTGTHTLARPAGEKIFRLHSDEFFVMGDNRPLSDDSREHGPVRRSEILGTIATRP
jgi:signal peptidase I